MADRKSVIRTTRNWVDLVIEEARRRNLDQDQDLDQTILDIQDEGMVVLELAENPAQDFDLDVVRETCGDPSKATDEMLVETLDSIKMELSPMPPD